MTNVFLYILVSSVMCSICGLSVLLLNSLLHEMSERFKCDILMLALLLPYAGFIAASLFPESVSVKDSLVKAAIGKSTENYYIASDIPAEAFSSPIIPEPQPTVVSVDIIDVVSWVWLMVAAAMLMYSIAKHMRLTAILHGERRLKCSIGRISVYTLNIDVSPFLTGFFRPAIYIPADTYDESEFELVIAHETAHYRRGDLFRRLLITVLGSVNWFNPIYRFVLKKLAMQIEYACDEAVTYALSAAESRNYGYMLLKTAEKVNRDKYLSVGLSSDAERLKSPMVKCQ